MEATWVGAGSGCGAPGVNANGALALALAAAGLPRGRAAEPDAEVGILVDGERELECAFEPGGDVAHPFSLVVSLRAALTGIGTIDRAYYTVADGDGHTKATREARLDVGGDPCD